MGIPDCELEEVGADTLARAVASIGAVDLSFAVLSTGQAERLLHRVGRGGCALRELVLHKVKLSEVSSAALASAAGCLHTLVLHSTELQPVQISDLLKRLGEGLERHKLKQLSLSSVSLAQTNPAILASGIATVEWVDLMDTCLQTTHLEALLPAVLTPMSSVHTLDIRMNPEACLQSVESFVKSAARHLSKFSFDSPRPEVEDDSESWQSSDETEATVYSSSSDEDEDELEEEFPD